ncbi:MFS transporter [Pseudarthrobacter sp. S9]|uniref:MFS transporter n=1 Tax=Pseudarthrobacter sp. S9 TaxID=3418421 RepID=UPI003CFF3202
MLLRAQHGESQLSGQTANGRPGIRAVFGYPAYRRLWAARTASAAGDAFATVALSLLVLDLTGSGLGVAGVVAAEIVPVLLLGPVAGVVVDRWSPVPVMVYADLARMVCALSLPLVLGSAAGVYALAFAMSAASVFFNPAAGSTVPSIVGSDELVAANSGIWSAAVFVQIVLAPAAGAVVLVAGYAPAFWVNAASFAVSALVLRKLRVDRAGSADASKDRWWPRAREGFALLGRQRVLRALAVGQLFAALSAGATSALLVVYVKDRLGLDSRGYGLALALIGAGAVLGPLVLSRFVSNPRRPAFVFGPYLLRAAVDGVLALTLSPVLALGALAGYGLGTSTGAVTFNSLLQAETPAEARGRVFTAFDVIWQLGRLVSLGIGGILADRAGLPIVYASGAVLLTAAALIGWTSLRAADKDRGSARIHDI